MGGLRPSYERPWSLSCLLRWAQGRWQKFEGKGGSHALWCFTKLALAAAGAVGWRQGGAGEGRQTSFRDHEDLNEGGSRELLERRGRFSGKPQQAASSFAQFNEPNLCFLNGLCFRGLELSVCSAHLL